MQKSMALIEVEIKFFSQNKFAALREIKNNLRKSFASELKGEREREREREREIVSEKVAVVEASCVTGPTAKL
jgi:hypothetical protein